MTRVRLGCLVLLGCGLVPATTPGLPPMERQLDVRVPMRDGVRLATNVFRPAVPGRMPTLLVRTPYGKGTSLHPNWQWFVERGYAVVVQDLRGRHRSEGKFQDVTQETPDGSDTIDWIARQPWSDGGVAMMGGSYLGIAQWRAALSGNPHLKAIAPVVAGWDEYRDRYYSRGGAFKLGHRLLWFSENVKRPGYLRPPFDVFTRHMPLRTADEMATGQRVGLHQQVLDHPSEDGYWRRQSSRQQVDRMRVPAFVVGGWYDNYVQSDLEAFAALRARGVSARVLIGPWGHNMSERLPGMDFGPLTGVPLRRLQAEWFDWWLRPGVRPAAADDPPVRLFVMGLNQWRDEAEWPLTRARATPYYLTSQGHANTLRGDGRLSPTPPVQAPPDRFTYDPRRPVPTHGGAVCCNPKVFPWGPRDQREVEQRQDVLVYTSATLKEDLEVTGPVKAVLHVSTSAPDTDFTAKLVDVLPSGEARIVTDGILRLRYRRSLERPEPLKRNSVMAVTVDMGVTSMVFLAGHRLRLEVSSSNFPRFDRNPNTGRPVADETRFLIATQTVFHDRVSPSHLLLPVVPTARQTVTSAKLTPTAPTRYGR